MSLSKEKELIPQGFSWVWSVVFAWMGTQKSLRRTTRKRFPITKTERYLDKKAASEHSQTQVMS